MFHSSCVILEPNSSLSSAINTDIEPYIRLLKKKCTESKTLLIVNENFTSLGNCGAWTWCEAVRLEPDILVLGNVLGAGLLPTGLYSARQNINNTVYGREHPALHGGTTAGNPLMCSIGIAVLNIIARENLILRTTTLIAIIKTFINNISEFNIKIFQIGIIMSLRFPTATFTERIRKDCYKNKVLLGILHGNELSILINPPLLISHSDLERGLFVLYLAIKNTMKIYISQPNYDTF